MKRVLIVDDDPDILMSLKLALEDRYAVATALDAAAALQWLEGNRADAVVVDLMMPIMDGSDLVREIRRRGNAPPIVITSAGMNLRARAAELGAFDCIAKPFDLSALEATIDRAVGGNGVDIGPAHASDQSSPASPTPPPAVRGRGA